RWFSAATQVGAMITICTAMTAIAWVSNIGSSHPNALVSRNSCPRPAAPSPPRRSPPRARPAAARRSARSCARGDGADHLRGPCRAWCGRRRRSGPGAGTVEPESAEPGYRGPGTDAGGGGEALTGSILVVPEDAGRQARGPRPGRYGSAPLSARRIALGSGGAGPGRVGRARCGAPAAAGHPAGPARRPESRAQGQGSHRCHGPCLRAGASGVAASASAFVACRQVACLLAVVGCEVAALAAVVGCEVAALATVVGCEVAAL